MGSAARASAASVTAIWGAPFTCTAPSASTRSSGAASNSSEARSKARARTALAAPSAALPPITAERLAKVPTPQAKRSLRPLSTTTCSGATLRVSATTCASVV